MVIDRHDDASLIQHAMKHEYIRALGELKLLEIAKERELTIGERAALSTTLCEATREELIEQIDPWITLVQHYSDLLTKLTFRIRS